MNASVLFGVYKHDHYVTRTLYIINDYDGKGCQEI